MGPQISAHRTGLATAVGTGDPVLRLPPPEVAADHLHHQCCIESLNSKLRTTVRSRGHFPNDEAATKLVFLVLREVGREWKMPPREWAAAKTQFAVMFGERFTAE